MRSIIWSRPVYLAPSTCHGMRRLIERCTCYSSGLCTVVRILRDLLDSIVAVAVWKAELDRKSGVHEQC